MAKWQKLNSENLRNDLLVGAVGTFDRIIIARRSDGKCCVGHVRSLDTNSVVIQNGNYETTLWFSEPRMFIMVDIPEVKIAREAQPRLALK